jgi:dTDP-4-amino-4,6-dideoxygalactose transaminase
MLSERTVELGEPVVGEPELKRIREVFETGWILNGPTVKEFEESFREYVGAEHAVGVVNCTAGMDLAFKALGLSGGKAIIGGQSFVANGIAMYQNDVEPLFVDVDPETYNLDPEAVEDCAEEADAIFVLHYAGHAAEMDRILEIANEYDLAVIEDAAHSLGSEYRGHRVGSFGDATVFSFGPLKLLTTSMGGMLTTPHDSVAEEIETLRSYGMASDAWSRDDEQYSWQYSIPTLGHNFRLTDVAAAMGLEQLDRVPSFIDHRRARAAEYTERFEAIEGIHPPVERSDRLHSYLYYVIRVGEEYPLSRNELAVSLEEAGVEVSVHWDPALHEHQAVREQVGDVTLPVSERLADQLLTLPMHPKLTTEDVEYVADVVRNHA